MLPAESVPIGDVEDPILGSRRLACPPRSASQQVGGRDLVQRSISLFGTGEAKRQAHFSTDRRVYADHRNKVQWAAQRWAADCSSGTQDGEVPLTALLSGAEQILLIV
jgi:hypothetical protein